MLVSGGIFSNFQCRIVYDVLRQIQFLRRLLDGILAAHTALHQLLNPSGGIIFGIVVTVLSQLGYITLSPETWMSAQAAGNLLLYFMIAITLIVVSVPEGLPMSVTLSLAKSCVLRARAGATSPTPAMCVSFCRTYPQIPAFFTVR